MDEHKIRNFNNDHPSGTFPVHVAQPMADCARLVATLAANLGLQGATGKSLIAALRSTASSRLGQVPQGTEFDFVQIVSSSGCEVDETVLVNWDAFETVEAFSASEFATYFDYVWYPSVDDIEIFDSSCRWILCVDHSGEWRLIVLGETL